MIAGKSRAPRSDCFCFHPPWQPCIDQGVSFLIVNGTTLHILNIDEGGVLTTGVGLFKQSVNVNLMTLVILASVNRETMDYNCPALGIISSPFKMKYMTVENGESMKHGFIREWLSVVHSLWGLLKYFTSPSWNFKSYEVKFKE